MRWLSKLILSVFSNAVAIFLATAFVSGFVFDGDIWDLAVIAAIFTLINIFVKPGLKLILGPFIILTLGLFVIVINALALYLLDIFSALLTIQGVAPLLIATVLIGVVNFVIHLSARAIK